MGRCCVTRIAWMTMLVVSVVLPLGAFAQEVIPDSYLITYRNEASALRSGVAQALSAGDSVQVLGGTYAKRSLGGKTEKLQRTALGSGRIAAFAREEGELAVGTESYGRKHEDFCNSYLVDHPEVESCSPDWVVHTSLTPNDARYQSLWGMKGEFGVAAPAAWNISQGADDVVVAVIDTGIDYTHPDLVANLWRNPGEIAGNGIDDDANGFVDDVYGANFSGNGRGAGDPFDDNSHGTHVSGTIAGVGNNGVGVVGVAWRAKIMALKFLNANGSGATSGAVEALNYLIAMKSRGTNVKVVNNSWGGGGDSAPLRDAIERANTAGILFTAAAGNSAFNIDERPQYPAAYTNTNILKVAAIDDQGNLASFSNYGVRLVDIAAPGVNILSTVPGNNYASYSGTSMATPHVTGVAALYIATHPAATMAQIKSAIIGSGRDLVTLSGIVKSGRTLDAHRAITDINVPISEPVAECPYTFSQGSFSPDTAADGKSPVVRADEDGFYTARLPFPFPFMGTYRSSITLSPNGVLYFGGAPAAWDNRNSATAPANSIAVLHTDLYPDPSLARGLGVRVSQQGDRVTVAWKARMYDRQNFDESVTARLSLYASGLIRMSYEMTSSGLESALSSVTVGVRGASQPSSSTYSGLVRNGMKLELVPSCTPVESLTHVDRLSVSPAAQVAVRGTARAGSRINIRGRVTGAGSVTLVSRIDGRMCERKPSIAVADGEVSRLIRIPSGLTAKRIAFSLVGEDGLSKSARLRIQRIRGAQARRNSTSNFNSLCNSLMQGIN